MTPHDFAIIGSPTNLDKEVEDNETVRRETGNRQLERTDSHVFIGLPYLSYYEPRGCDYVPHFSDKHTKLVIESWDFVPDFISEVRAKRQLLILITDYILT